MLNYFGCTIAQLRILRLCAISNQAHLKKQLFKEQLLAKLLWFYNYSNEDFRTSEAQVWVAVKIPKPRYLDPHPVFLTDCAICYQDRLRKANI